MHSTQYTAVFISTATGCVRIVKDVCTVALDTISINPVSSIWIISPPRSIGVIKRRLNLQPCQSAVPPCLSHALQESKDKLGRWISREERSRFGRFGDGVEGIHGRTVGRRSGEGKESGKKRD